VGQLEAGAGRRRRVLDCVRVRQKHNAVTRDNASKSARSLACVRVGAGRAHACFVRPRCGVR
jgi:hypothetical protein